MTQDEFNEFDKDFEVCSCMGVTLEEMLNNFPDIKLSETDNRCIPN